MGFDPGFERPTCLTTLKSSDRTKQECGMPRFSLAVTEWQMSIRTAEVRPYYFLLWWRHERSTSRSRRRLGSSRVMPGLLSEPIWCKKNPTKSAMKAVHHWRPTLMHLGCMIEMSVDDNIYAPPWGLSSLAKELSAAARIMQSSSKELSTLVTDRV